MAKPSDARLEDLVEPWIEIDAEDVVLLEAEFVREIAEGHELWGRQAKALARRTDRDDVLFVHDQGFSVVHLTYTSGERPPVPSTVTYLTWREFVEDRLPIDALDWD